MMELGLFPLGIVLLPTERVPLHVFEPRYRELIGECVETDGEFGLLYADEDGVRDVGTLARITEVLERFDGLSLVEQHRLVYHALATPLADGTIHELRIKTRGAA